MPHFQVLWVDLPAKEAFGAALDAAEAALAFIEIVDVLNAAKESGALVVVDAVDALALDAVVACRAVFTPIDDAILPDRLCLGGIGFVIM